MENGNELYHLVSGAFGIVSLVLVCWLICFWLEGIVENFVRPLWRWARKDRSVHWHGFEEKGGSAARS